MNRALVIALVVLLSASAGCARHVVMARDAGRVDGERSISSASDTAWHVDHEPEDTSRH